LAADGLLDASDGLVARGALSFLAVISSLRRVKHNVTRRKSFSVFSTSMCWVLLAAAYVVYVSLDWLVVWLSAQRGGNFLPRNISAG